MKIRLATLLLAAWPLGVQAQEPAPSPAQPNTQSCPPLVRITSVKLERLPNSRRVAVPVSINGVPKKFLLDTAGLAGFITKEAADELDLPGPPRSSKGIRIVGTFGLGDQTYQLGDPNGTDSTLIASLKPATGPRDGDIDGTLTNAFLLNKGELDLDFPGGTLSLFSPNHCPGQVNHWGAPDVGSLPLNIDTVGIGNARGNFFRLILPRDVNMKADLGHMTIPVTLDGQKLNGWIDTSAEKSSISLEVAERLFKLRGSDLGPQTEAKIFPESALGFLNLKGNPIAAARVHKHKFGNLAIGHIDIKNLELLVARDTDGRNGDPARHILYTPHFYVKTVWNRDVAGMADTRDDKAEHYANENAGKVEAGNRKSQFSNADKDVPDMVLGMDVLRHLHLYISLKEGRVYFSPGAAPAAPPQP